MLQHDMPQNDATLTQHSPSAPRPAAGLLAPDYVLLCLRVIMFIYLWLCVIIVKILVVCVCVCVCLSPSYDCLVYV